MSDAAEGRYEGSRCDHQAERDHRGCDRDEAESPRWVTLKICPTSATDDPGASVPAFVFWPADFLPTDCPDILQASRGVFRQEIVSKEPKWRNIQHEIDTGDSKPTNLACYPMTKVHRDELDRQVQLLLDKGLIRPSSSPWGSPVLFVPKPGAEWRMCVDYRLLNNVTKKDAYPLPRIQDCLDTIGAARYLSKVDLTSGYYQLEMHPEAIPKTAFTTRSGKYEWIAMPRSD
jgi:hypothetical protein